jgi:hypothetical protein
MRIFGLVTFACLTACVDLSTICPYKAPVTQGVFGEITDSTGAIEEGVEVDLYTLENGEQDNLVGSASTGRAGYQFQVNASTYELCAKTVCAQVMVPTGVVEFSAADSGSGVTWDQPVAVPPAQTIGPCTWGG